MVVILLAIVMGGAVRQIVFDARLQAQQNLGGHLALARLHDAHRARHSVPDVSRHAGDGVGVHQVGLVEDDEIGAEQLVRIDLFEGIIVVDGQIFRALGQQFCGIVGEAACGHGGAIHHGDDGVHREARADRGPVEGLHEGLGQGEAGGFDHDMIGALGQAQQGLDGGGEIVRHGAADAAIGEFDDVFLRAGFHAAGAQNVAIHAHIAKFIDDEREAPTACVLQQIADDRGLARAQKARDDGDGNPGEIGCAHGWFSEGESSGGTRETTPRLSASGRCFQGMRPSLVAP